MKTQTRNTMMLVLCALIWGLAFVAQSAGAALAPFAFLACRSWLAWRSCGRCAMCSTPSAAAKGSPPRPAPAPGAGCC